MRKPIQRVNVDFTAAMLEELERTAKDLNISRQAVIKTLIRQGLDLNQKARALRAYARLRRLRGKVRFSRTPAELKADR